MSNVRNVFACLVHENQECVIDLVRNLRFLDPDSVILLYNGGNSHELLNRHFPFERYGVVVHPAPRQVAWGVLHPFALDSMTWALENEVFDTLTIVDSDQLLTRHGYSEYLRRHLAASENIGVLGSSAIVQTAGTRVGPAEVAHREFELWRPLLRKFPRGEEKFVHWCFWPSTVFLADAVRDLTHLFATNHLLQEIMKRTCIWASEEVILPTLVALLGYKVEINPASLDFVRYRVSYDSHQIECALEREDVYWMHPVPRQYADPLRKRIREQFDQYGRKLGAGYATRQANPTTSPGLLLTIPILERMHSIEGWLEDKEADLLIASVIDALRNFPEAPNIVEIGSYCGRSTVVLGCAVKAADGLRGASICAIDPHDGRVGALDRGIEQVEPSLDKFQNNITAAGLTTLVETVRSDPLNVLWGRPICFLLIDGLHDYPNVARDFYHFEPWVVVGGYVAFHDYADYYPGVVTFVDEILNGGAYERVCCAASLIVLKKSGKAARVEVEIIRVEPLISCIMPTANRRAFVPNAIRYFLRQDYANRELLILDDGSDSVSDLIPDDPRIRYVYLQDRRTLGAKHNLACQHARGDLIAHWDDDDWYARWRLSYQVAELLKHPPMTLVGLSRVLFYRPWDRCAWEYVCPSELFPWVCGNTLCYRKEFWKRNPFPDLDEGADTVFVSHLDRTCVISLANNRWLVAIVHSGNTSSKRTDDLAWRPVIAAEVRNLLASDIFLYDTSFGSAKVGT